MDFSICKSWLFLFLAMCMGNLKSQAPDSNATCSSAGCCCENDPSPAGVMLSHVHAKNQWMISYRFMSMNQSGLSKGLRSQQKDEVFRTYLASPDVMTMNMHMLMVMYGISSRFTTMLMLNYQTNYMEMSMPAGKQVHRHSMSSQGLGDTKVYLLYAPVLADSWQILGSLGLSLPTGNTQVKGETGAAMFAGQRLPYAMQTGSGAFGVLPAFTCLRQWKNFTGSAQAFATVQLTKNKIGYKNGNEAGGMLWLAWQYLSFLSSSIRLEATSTGTINGTDPGLNRFEEPSANPSNYGGTRATAFLGTTLQFKKGILKTNRLAFEYGLPVLQNLNGIQLKTRYSFYATWSIQF